MTSLAAGAASQFTTTSITGAGLAVGIALLAIEHIRWWRGGRAGTAGKDEGGKAKDPKALIPTWFGVAFGVIAVGCPAGALGIGAGLFRWSGNTFGGFVMNFFTGQTSSAVATGAAPALTSNGALIVTALVITLIALRKAFPKTSRGKFWRGAFAGCLVTIGTGMFMYLGKVVIPTVNEVGAQVMGTVVHGTLL
ncbi:hypothetical protein [Streptomyces thermolilacinus]|uniref:hypothetical protein n=1 Tax=Streptomyces thermolilacinus TaxID=285540 RepID=UPI0033D0DEAF